MDEQTRWGIVKKPKLGTKEIETNEDKLDEIVNIPEVLVETLICPVSKIKYRIN